MIDTYCVGVAIILIDQMERNSEQMFLWWTSSEFVILLLI